MSTKNNKPPRNQEDFIKHFEETYGDTVLHMELAELICNEEALKETGITNSNKSANLQGLFLFCRNEIYFYIPASANLISSIINRDSSQEPEDECSCLTQLNIAFELPVKKKLDFLFPKASRTLHGEFTGSSGSTEKMNFFFINPIEKFRIFFTESKYSVTLKTNEQ